MKPLAAMMRSFAADTSGAGAAEFALIVPTFLLLVFSTINAGLAMSAISQMHFAAEKSARCLSVDVAGACSAAGIDDYAKAIYEGPQLAGLTFTPSTQSCGKQVVGTGSLDLITGFSRTAVTLTAQACYPLI